MGGNSLSLFGKIVEVCERETEFIMVCVERGGEVGRGWRGGIVERVELLSAIWMSSLVLRWRGGKGKGGRGNGGGREEGWRNR